MAAFDSLLVEVLLPFEAEVPDLEEDELLAGVLTDLVGVVFLLDSPTFWPLFDFSVELLLSTAFRVELPVETSLLDTFPEDELPVETSLLDTFPEDDSETLSALLPDELPEDEYRFEE